MTLGEQIDKLVDNDLEKGFEEFTEKLSTVLVESAKNKEDYIIIEIISNNSNHIAEKILGWLSSQGLGLRSRLISNFNVNIVIELHGELSFFISTTHYLRHNVRGNIFWELEQKQK